MGAITELTRRNCLPLDVRKELVIETLLFGVTPSDPVVLISAGAVTLAAAAAATYLPARRVAAIAPTESLRSQ